MSAKVLAIKLVTGEEVIGATSTTSDGRFLVQRPVSIRMFPSTIQGGEPTMGFVPFPGLCDPDNHQPIVLEPLHIVYSYVPYPDMVKSYTDMLQSPTESKQIITG